MNIYVFSCLCFGFGVFLVAVLVAAKRWDDIAKSFLFFSISVSGWAFFSALWVSQTYSENQTVILIKMAHAFALFIPSTWCEFVFKFLNKKKPFDYFSYINFSIPYLLLPFFFSDYFIEGAQSLIGLRYLTKPGPLYSIFTVQFFVLVTYALCLLAKAFLNASGRYQDQIKYLLIGTLLGFCGGGSTFPQVYKFELPMIGLAITPAFPLFTGIALIRYGLFEVEGFAQAARRDKLAAIGTLATSINHEIRNPLFIIQGLSDSHLVNIKEGIYSNIEQGFDRSNKILATISAQAKRAMDIMGKFSLFAKRTVTPPDVHKCNVYNILESIIPLVEYELELEKITLVVEIDKACTVFIDPRHLEEIFFNLIVNACQAIKAVKNSGKIRVSAQTCERDVILSVSDDGPGISAKEQKQIFDPFFTTKEKGTGLGLYVVKQLIEQNSGTIRVQSEIGLGTRFTIQLRNAFSTSSQPLLTLSKG